MTLVLSEKIEIIVQRYNPEEIVDILGITSEQLMEAFGDEVVGRWHLFEGGEENVDG